MVILLPLLSLVPSLEIAGYFGHHQLGFRIIQTGYPANEVLSLFAFQDHNLLPIPENEHFIVFTFLVREDVFFKSIAFVYGGHWDVWSSFWTVVPSLSNFSNALYFHQRIERILFHGNRRSGWFMRPKYFGISFIHPGKIVH